MNILSAYTAYSRPAGYGSAQTHSASRSSTEQPISKPQADALSATSTIDFIPARPDEDTIAHMAARDGRDLPKNIQSFVTTENQDEHSRIGRFLDIHA